tara:strand:- start:118 stop:246 length:129 start_codon:yes stop_codon:yes gene_type:complete
MNIIEFIQRLSSEEDCKLKFKANRGSTPNSSKKKPPQMGRLS